MGAVGLAGMLALPGVNPALFPQRMFGMIDTYALLALPLFVLAGSLMSHGALSLHLVRFARPLVGHFQAGLCHVSIVSSMVFAGVSGSSTADASAIGSVVIPTMKGAGYKPGFAAALIACAGTIGAIIPPSMVMVVYGSMAQVSIGGLFLGGIIPGVLVGLFLMITVKLHTYLPGFPELREATDRFDLCEVWRAMLEVRPALLAPLVILGGILSGIFTATEAGLVACFYAFLVSKFVYKQLTFADLPRIFLDAAIITSMVSGIIAMAGRLGWLLAYLAFNEVTIKLLTSVTTSKKQSPRLLAA
jgi:tripartite ATP-independent transporter DctM subunit